MKVIDLSRKAVAAIGSSASLPIVADWTNDRINELLSRVNQESERTFDSFIAEATITAGTIGVTKGSNLVTAANAQSQAAWDGVDLVGRFLRITGSRELYEVVGQDANLSIHLGSNFVSATSAGVGYELVKRFHLLNKLARHLGRFKYKNGRLNETSVLELDRLYPDRRDKSNSPIWWCPTGREPDGTLRVEIYPWPSAEDIQVQYSFYRSPAVAAVHDEVPSFIDTYVLKVGVIADIALWEQSRAIREKDQVGAGFWANLSSRKLSEWRRVVQDAIKAGRPTRNGRVIVQRGGLVQSDIRSARDQIESRGVNL